MITVTGASVAHGARVLFRDVALQVVPGRRVAIVGPNGAGKTTLLELLAGERVPDGGTVTRARDLSVGFLRQEVAESRGRTVLAEVMAAAEAITAAEARMRELEAALPEVRPGADEEALLEAYGDAQHRFELLGGYRLESDARTILAGLGVPDADVLRDVGELSGGWMMRVALARLLLAAPGLLLLDEPTNHLDLASVLWLQSFLASYRGGMVVVSHDRDFIDAVADRVVELSGGRATEYVGGYTEFVEQRAIREEQLLAAARNQQRKIEQTERFIGRFRYKASKAKQVQSRVKQLERLERVAAPLPPPRSMRFRFPAPPRSGKVVVRLAGIVKRYGDKTVYDGLDLELLRGEKVALIGPNGAGKSTLLKILAGVLPLDGGARELGHNVEAAYFAQHQIDGLDSTHTVLDEFSSGLTDAESRAGARRTLGAFLFPGDDVDKRVGVLSGGERTRLALAKLLARPVNLLCVDEPTNHLDIPSRDVVEDALTDYPGTVVLITHDQHLIREVATTIIDIDAGAVTVWPGDYETYEWRREQAASASPPAPERTRTVDRPARRQASAAVRDDARKRTAAARTALTEVERELGEVESEIAELHRLLADPAVHRDGDRARALVAAHEVAKDRAAELTDLWESRYRELESVRSERAQDDRAVAR